MFREIRRKDRQLTMEESVEILKNNDVGILSTICENGYPYGVPLNYIYFNNSIYFHCALEGQKLDNIKACDKVSFCVNCDVEILPEEFSTNYKSTVIFGKASEVIGKEKDEALLEIIKKYSSDFIEKGMNYINNAKERTKVYKISIEHLSGKSRK